jgi:hypothetical protein
MIARLLGFLFLGILLVLAYHLGFNLIYARYFAASPFFQTYWYVSLVLVPAAVLAVLAWWLGFYRRGGRRGEDAAASLILAALVILTIPASYSCGSSGCF